MISCFGTLLLGSVELPHPSVQSEGEMGSGMHGPGPEDCPVPVLAFPEVEFGPEINQCAIRANTVVWRKIPSHDLLRFEKGFRVMIFCPCPFFRDD